MILMRRMSTTEPHHSHLSHKKTILMQEMTTDCYDHVQLRILSSDSGRIAALQLYSGHACADTFLLSTSLGLCSIRLLPHLAIYPALT